MSGQPNNKDSLGKRGMKTARNNPFPQMAAGSKIICENHIYIYTLCTYIIWYIYMYTICEK